MMSSDRAMVVVAGDGLPPSKVRKNFDKLLAKLDAQREELARWRAFRVSYQAQLSAEYEPLAARLRAKRIALAVLFDRTLADDALGRRDRGRLREILKELLDDLLREGEDATLIRIHDNHADVSFEDLSAARMKYLRTLAGESLGVDVADYRGSESPEEFGDWLEERAKRARAESAADAPSSGDAPSEKRVNAAERKQEYGRQAVREVFRKLVSALHPDRESDPAERARKTALMQLVNRAYQARDLVALLELQHIATRVDATALGRMPEERLRRYTQALADQSKRLADELRDFIAPFATAVGTGRKITPEAVRRALATDLLELKRRIRDVEADLLRFRDISLLRRSLR